MLDVAVNVALLKQAVQSSTFWTKVASRAVDSNVHTVACSHYSKSSQPWWAVDLGAEMDVARVCLINDHNHQLGQLQLGMYRIVIFKIRPEPESTGYQMNYPAGTGTGYL